jgi:hypothetical protein
MRSVVSGVRCDHLKPRPDIALRGKPRLADHAGLLAVDGKWFLRTATGAVICAPALFVPGDRAAGRIDGTVRGQSLDGKGRRARVVLRFFNFCNHGSDFTL